jgi:hypothetical protein
MIIHVPNREYDAAIDLPPPRSFPISNIFYVAARTPSTIYCFSLQPAASGSDRDECRSADLDGLDLAGLD